MKKSKGKERKGKKEEENKKTREEKNKTRKEKEREDKINNNVVRICNPIYIYLYSVCVSSVILFIFICLLIYIPFTIHACSIGHFICIFICTPICISCGPHFICLCSICIQLYSDVYLLVFHLYSYLYSFVFPFIFYLHCNCKK